MKTKKKTDRKKRKNIRLSSKHEQGLKFSENDLKSVAKNREKEKKEHLIELKT